MPFEPAPAETAFKHWFDADRYRNLAEHLAAIAPAFDHRRFLEITLTGLPERELMDRLRQTAIGCEAALPGSYRDKVEVLRQLAPLVQHTFVGVALCDFVARYGLDDPDFSLEALRYLTQFGSAEFAVRPFLVRDLERTLATMTAWSLDENEHVRRLASEGSRPRLPWGLRLTALVQDPRPTGTLLERLKDDPSLYVRKSVANHLNDIAKDHPDQVIARVSAWDRTRPGTAWIVRHALRTLVKRGDARALALMGATARTAVSVDVFKVSPRRLRLGGVLTLEATLTSTGRRRQTLVVDYVVHYVKANGGTSAKVFKWTRVELPPGESVKLVKRQVVKDFSIRRLNEGEHRVELQINGRRPKQSGFNLKRT
ncbi:MAG: DNA alkylation repair protein [Opitutaceae bacterium]